MRCDTLQVIRVQEEVPLDALDGVQDGAEGNAEDQDGLRVRLPVLLVATAAAQKPQEAAFDRVELLARVRPGHEDPERVAERDQDEAVEDDLRESLAAHLESLPAEQRVDEVRQNRERHHEAERVTGGHQTFSIT